MHLFSTFQTRQIIFILSLSILLSVLSACAQEQPTLSESPTREFIEPTSSGTVENGYPVERSTDIVDSESGYPVATKSTNNQTSDNIEDAYPVDNNNEPANNTGSLLAFSEPVHPQDTLVNGVGPAGLSVHIVNVTFMGSVAGSGIIEDDGTFSIAIPTQENGVQLGLFADIESSGLTPKDILPGEGELTVPQVGHFFDTLIVTE